MSTDEPATRGIIIPIPRIPDGSAVWLVFTGGLRARQLNADNWLVEPVLHEGKACAKGPISRSKLNEIVQRGKLKAIARHTVSWTNGYCSSFWNPIEDEHFRDAASASSLWGRISRNLSEKDIKENIQKIKGSDINLISEALDSKDRVHVLTNYISNCLTIIDSSIEQVFSYYHEKITEHVTDEMPSNNKIYLEFNQNMVANIHSFFVSIGSARDYLGSLILERLGTNNLDSIRREDSMSTLRSKLSLEDRHKDNLLDRLISLGALQPEISGKTKLVESGWLAEATKLRDRYVHRRPFGSRFREQCGSLIAIVPEMGLYRYQQPVLGDDGSIHGDILDVMTYHYHQANSLFRSMAEASGWKTDILTISSDQIISTDLKRIEE